MKRSSGPTLEEGATVLSIENINAGYGDMQVLYDITMHVEKGECVAMVGSNGAGKTSLLRIISGLLTPMSGSVRFEGIDLLAQPAHKRAELGIAHVPQGRGILGTLNVMDNLIMGGYNPRTKAQRAEKIERAFESFPKLKQRRHQIAGSLSGGEQQMLAIARALIMDPKLLMLDEPSLGLAPIIVDEVFDTLEQIAKQDVSVLIIEQNLAAAMSIASRGYVIETGHVYMEDSSENLMNNEEIKKAYLGV